MPAVFDFSHQGHALVTLYVQVLCSDWSKFDRWVHAENLCSILKLVYFAEADRVLCQLVMFSTVFFHWMYKMKFSCYQSLLLFMASLFIEFLVEKYVACQSRKSDFVFHLAWCVRGLKSLKRYWPYLIVFSASRVVSLSNYCIWCLFFTSNIMKSGVVYAAI